MSPNLPEAYQNRMKELLGEEAYRAYALSLSGERLYGLRVNTRKCTPEAYRMRSPFGLNPVPWTRSGFYYAADEKPAKHPDYYAGLYYLQEPSAMAPAEILPIEPGDRVLDLCAAPGGKSTAIADRLGGTGILVSNDISASRCKALLKNVELSGTENAVVLSEDPSRLSARFDSFFDKILIDAPCSGEGMFRKDPSVIKSWEEHGNDFYVRLQHSILESAVRMLKPGGMLLYSTCTFAPEEDEEAVLYALSLDPELKIADIPDRFSGFDPGLTEIQGRTVLELSKTVRIYPHRLSGEGHFGALLQKEGASVRNGLSMPSLLAEKPGFKALPAEAREFLSRIRKPFFEGNFEVRNGWVSYRTALSDELLKGLRILRNGLLLGECRKDRFEPSQALAMALSAEEFDSVVSFPASDERVLKYLKGETIEADSCANGWVLVALDRYPLGFAKASNGVLKNKYLPGWRYQ